MPSPPGIVSVGLAKHQWDTDPSYRARAQKAIPLGEMQPLDSVANAFLFLCSPAADYMTGSVLLVDGGVQPVPNGLTIQNGLRRLPTNISTVPRRVI